MSDPTLVHVDRRLRRLERKNRVLVILLGATLTLGSIAVSNAQQTVITADEVRARRFNLLAPNGRVVESWYTDEKGEIYRQTF
jgi:hypothetical protein